MSNEPVCVVCGEPFPDDYDKFDPEAPVYADEEDARYHKGCEDEIFDEVICEL